MGNGIFGVDCGKAEEVVMREGLCCVWYSKHIRQRSIEGSSRKVFRRSRGCLFFVVVFGSAGLLECEILFLG